VRSVPAGPKTTPVRARITTRTAPLADRSCNVAVIRAEGQFGMMSAME
jgi:hypothetical protein